MGSLYTPTQPSENTAPLRPRHLRHFQDEGWTPAEIETAQSLGVRSISAAEAADLLGYRPPSGGIWFPFSDSWGQLRPDSRSYPNGQESPKYCSPSGGIDGAALWLPPGAESAADLDGVTEGWKDAFLAFARTGKKVGAIAGVSHVAKALPESAGVPLIFDADGWSNASVMGALISGGIHLAGRIALIPEGYGAKAGFTELLAGGGQWADLEFYSPSDLLREWSRRLIAEPLKLPKHCDDLPALYRKLRKLGRACGLRRRELAELQATHSASWRRAFEADKRAAQVLPLEDAPVGQFEPLSLPASGRKLFALNGQKGTGKTSRAIQGLVRDARAAGLSVLAYVPTQALSRVAAAKLGLDCHLDKVAAARSNYLMACGESAHLYSGRRWDIVIIDECNEVLPRSWQGLLGQNPKAARAALAGQIAAAQVVAIAQDGLYRPVLNAVQRLGNFSADQVEVISRRRPRSHATIEVYHGAAGYAAWVDKLLSSAQSGERVAIPSGSEKEVTVLQRWLRQRHPEGNHRKLTGKSKSFSGDRTAFARNPDGWVSTTAPSTLGFSPVFNSGVSLEVSYFTQQFEYVAALETATAASQRGERVRAAIGGIPRRVFFQKRGLPALPPLEVFEPEYWRGILLAEDRQTLPNFKALGLGDLAAALEKGTAPVAQFPELAEVLAVQAREIHFKEETLRAEWTANGWEVVAVEGADEVKAKALAEERREICAGIQQSQARALSLAPSLVEAEQRNSETLTAFRSGLEAAGPVAAAKFCRWKVEGRIGNLDLMASPEFWAAFYLSGSEEISEAQLNALLRLQFEQPEVWHEVQRNLALQRIGSQAVRDAAAEQTAAGRHHGTEDLPVVPELVASPRLIHLATLLGKCPGVREVFAGKLTQWDKATAQVEAAHRWAVIHAKELAALSRHSQRWFGLQFTPRTPAVAAFNKLLGLAGLKAQQDGQRERRWQYRLQTAADVAALIQAAEKAGRTTARLAQQQYRAAHHREVVEGAIATALNRHYGAADNWAALEGFARRHFGLNTEIQGDISNTSESLCAPLNLPEGYVPEPPAESWEELLGQLDRARPWGAAAVATVWDRFFSHAPTPVPTN